MMINWRLAADGMDKGIRDTGPIFRGMDKYQCQIVSNTLARTRSAIELYMLETEFYKHDIDGMRCPNLAIDKLTELEWKRR